MSLNKLPPGGAIFCFRLKDFFAPPDIWCNEVSINTPDAGQWIAT